MIGGRGALALPQQRSVQADEIGVAQGFVQWRVANRHPLAADTTLEAEIQYFLYRFNVIVIFVGWIEAKKVHVESGALLDEGLANAACADDGYRFAGDLIAEKGQVGMPVPPAIFAGEMFGGPEFPGQRAHQKEGELGGRFC